MMSDQLSEVLDQIEVRGVVSGGFSANGHWSGRAEIPDELKFFALLRGNMRVTVSGLDEVFELESGDVVVLNGRSWATLEGGPEDGPLLDIPRPDSTFDHFGAASETSDIVLGGRVELDPAGRSLLLQALPPVAHVRAAASASTQLRDNLEHLFAEVTSDTIGSAFAARQYAQLLVLEILRAYVAQSVLPAGWLKATTDEQLRPALALIHSKPGTAWRLDQLAHAASMSRTSFAERFRKVTGTPPLTYLSNWRMILAKRALRDGNTTVGSIATHLGYGSDSAFSTAFKREVGEAPLRYRARVRRSVLD